MRFEWIDGVILAVIMISVLTGLIRGFVKEIISLASWVIALTLAFYYASSFEPWFSTYINDVAVRTIISFLLILIVTLFLGGIVNALVGFVLKSVGMSGTDRSLGMFFGLLRGVFIVSLVIVTVKMSAIDEKGVEKHSLLYAKFTPLVEIIYRHVPDVLKKIDEIKPEEFKTEKPLLMTLEGSVENLY